MEDITEIVNYNKTLSRWRGFRNVLNYDADAEVNMDPSVT